MKPDLLYCKKLLESGLSLLTVGHEKTPNIKWKELQKTPLSVDAFENFYNLDNTNGVGIITGFSNIECIDVDLKVIDTQQEREKFWNEFFNLLKDNIYEFESKVVITKTKNLGYHIIYRCEKIIGNVKIATPEGKTEALIESRGVGGYIFVYNNFITQNDYTNIQEITLEEREIIWHVCRLYNHEIQKTVDKIEFKDVPKEHHETDVKIWDDYNSKVSVFDLVGGEFQIIKKLHNKIIIRRNGAKSPHSGYVFDNSRCMYLFSTGTIYPAEKLLSPFHIYTIKYHNGNFSEAAKKLYREGYGSRIKPQKKIISDQEKIEITTDEFPIDIFPPDIQRYIIEIERTLNASRDYLGCSLLWVISLCIGNSIKIEIKRGWKEACVVWIAIVGRAGIGKTHNIEAMTRPLSKMNEKEIKRYNDNLRSFEAYNELTKKEKEYAPNVEPPIKSQFIVGDITLESFFDHHENNPNGIGILRDELSGWIKDLNKYREGSDLETYISCWSNQQILLNRKTAKSSFVQKAFVPIIGGVQPSILSLHYTEENKDNGFMDRWLLCYPELKVGKYNDREIDCDFLRWYDEYIVCFFETFKSKVMKYDDSKNIDSLTARFSPEAKTEWIRIFNNITDMQNSDDENEYMKSILPKQKSYVARFSLIINCLECFENGQPIEIISKKSILAAEKLSNYFIKMAKKNKAESIEDKGIKDVIKFAGKKSVKEKFIDMYEQNKELNRTKVANELNVSRRTVCTWISELETGVK